MSTPLDFDADMERTPPHDKGAEQALLGSMMSSRNAIADAIETLTTGADLYYEHHRTIYNTIIDMYGRGEPANPILLADRLRKDGNLANVGGAPYLHICVNQMTVAADAAHYAEIIRDCAILYRLGEEATRIQQAVYGAKGDPHGLVEAAQAGIASVLTADSIRRQTLIGDDHDDYLDRLEQLQNHGRTLGVPTGFVDLDTLTGGFMPGEVVIVAARPAMGKSTLALDFLRSAAITHGMPSAFFSLEMGRDEIKHRVYSAQGKIPLHHIRQQGGMTNDDWTAFARVTADITAAPLHIDAEPNQTLARVQARCRAMQQATGLRLVVIDYLQLMQSGAARRAESRQQEVSDMTRSIKLLAKELQVPIVLLSQLNRGPEQRQDKKPMVSDLRESGAIEQDADIVILLHREDAYDKETPRAGEADLIVAKHRNGPTCTITTAFQGHYSRFVDLGAG